MLYEIGVDVSGTFTDLIVSGSNSDLLASKVPTNRQDESQGIMDGLSDLADRVGLSIKDLLNQTSFIVLGTTVAANDMLEYKGSNTGLIATRGFRDMIEIRRGFKESVDDVRFP